MSRSARRPNSACSNTPNGWARGNATCSRRAEGASTGRSLFQPALEGGAQALGAGPSGLRAGAAADIVALDASHAAFAGRGGDGWLDGWIFAAGGAVDTVWRRGEAVVRNGKHVAREPIERRYRATLRRLLAG